MPTRQEDMERRQKLTDAESGRLRHIHGEIATHTGEIVTHTGRDSNTYMERYIAGDGPLSGGN